MYAKSMSVMQMAKLLGIKKTAAFRLAQIANFETVQIGRSRRILMDSFEEWYAHQLHYHKVNGELPGTAYGELITLSEIVAEYGIPMTSLCALIDALKLDEKKVGNRKAIFRSDINKLLDLRKERMELYGINSKKR